MDSVKKAQEAAAAEVRSRATQLCEQHKVRLVEGGFYLVLELVHLIFLGLIKKSCGIVHGVD